MPTVGEADRDALLWLLEERRALRACGRHAIQIRRKDSESFFGSHTWRAPMRSPCLPLAFAHRVALVFAVAAIILILSHPAPTAAAESQKPRMPHPGFVYLADSVPDVVLDIRYYGANNFVGAKVEGYNAPVGIVSEAAARALQKVSADVRTRGYLLKIFDAYRPQSAVNHFIRWAKDMEDTRTKAAFYPGEEKRLLFARGYIASRSGHSRGSTLDLTLVDVRTGKELDMGSPFDFFGDISRHGAAGLTPEQAANRNLLKRAMEVGGFSAYSGEWWHYTLKNEPFPNTYFTFPVE